MVLIASPKAELRRQWTQGLQGITGIHEVATRAALERSMANLKPSILLLDLALPKLGGVNSVCSIQRLSPPTNILLFTNRPDEAEGISALKAAAKGYSNDDIDPSLLKKAVERIQKGEIWAGRNLISRLVEELISLSERGENDSLPSPDSRFDRLTPREREVVHLIGGGASNKEIASRLTVTERTVKAHLTAIFRKLGVTDRLRLALFVTKRTRVSR